MNDILKVAQDLVNVEIQGIQALHDYLADNQNFIDAINILYNCKGKIVVTGMGKSGHIGHKISATLSSTGTPSIFVHPAEASHGDLGMINDHDVVIALSNSGETAELSDIISYCTRFSIPLIAISRNPHSTLAQASKVALNIPNTDEACILKLAPTTSTTQSIVLGDAIAISLLDKRGFTADDFYKYHPGGKLGQQLLTVENLMHIQDELPLITSDKSLKEAISIISEKKFGCVGILESMTENHKDPKHRQLVGIITDGDLRRIFQSDDLNHSLSAPVSEFIKVKPITLLHTSLASKALSIMEEKKISSIFIEDKDNKVLGLIHLQDCLKAGVI